MTEASFRPKNDLRTERAAKKRVFYKRAWQPTVHLCEGSCVPSGVQGPSRFLWAIIVVVASRRTAYTLIVLFRGKPKAGVSSR